MLMKQDPVYSMHTLKAFLFLNFELWGVVFFDLIIKDIGEFKFYLEYYLTNSEVLLRIRMIH